LTEGEWGGEKKWGGTEGAAKKKTSSLKGECGSGGGEARGKGGTWTKEGHLRPPVEKEGGRGLFTGDPT